ncbi:hypothetical protein M406DRAFT_331813 [Cryphonectria parasitica EP155]|uniref:Uncharacterized protein n=1 Tax=Cryphonectria parasitica (strain ATCC 38755 / EP155) TaxID=660469 RepID=A0A9P5CLF5_CRYP1|nr:uncharacterized protein M406DRAFT_331813 [Cryphonectria parasitica EP155]KAF3763279.1 hypothetical protein M406DRAFT_331813 [Cryphonectria parasitica EP155]
MLSRWLGLVWAVGVYDQFLQGRCRFLLLLLLVKEDLVAMGSEAASYEDRADEEGIMNIEVVEEGPQVVDIEGWDEESRVLGCQAVHDQGHVVINEVAEEVMLEARIEDEV